MEAVIVRIVGANDAWQGAADQARRRLIGGFRPAGAGGVLRGLLARARPLPQALALIRLGAAPLPLVFIGDELLSTGGKVLIPEISRRLEALGLRRDGA